MERKDTPRPKSNSAVLCRHAIVVMTFVEFSALAMACTGDCGLSTMPLRGCGALVMSALLHLAGAALWLSLQAPARLEDDPVRPMMVEIALEAPLPAASADPIRPEKKPAVHKAVTRPLAPKAAAVTRSAAIADTPMARKEETSPLPASPPLPPPRTVSATEYGAYVGRLHDRIAQRRIYPPQSIRRREEGDVRLRIMLATDGRLLRIHTLAEASALLTQAARDAVESSAPFDPPPLASPADQDMAFDVTVAFRIR